MMFTAEQEAQLSEWGCPLVTAVIPLPDDESGYTDYRQPHDVLAWLSAAYSADAELHCGGGVSWRALLFGCNSPRAHPDPYSAVYALARAVMEAK